MLTKCDFNNVDGSHNFSFNSNKSPLNVFDVLPNQRVDTGRNKMQRHGVNSTLTFRGGMEIHLEGALFDDTTAAFVTLRKTMVVALFGVASATPDLTNRKLGDLIIRLDGETEDWKTACTVTAFTAPVKANYPTLVEFAVSFFSWDAWFTGATSGNKYYWS